jgi:beta-xylosidase
VTALTALALLALSVIGYDVAVVTAGHRSERALTVTRRQLVSAQAELTRARARTITVTATRDARREAEVRTVGEIASANQNLGSESRTKFFQGISIGTLNTCLDGVAQAVSAISAANLGAAVNSIDQASSSCLSLDGSNTGLVYPYDFPDPFILPVGGVYYGYATNSVAGNIQIIRSTDLTHWTTVGDALPQEPSWAAPNATWAPSVLQRGSTFVLYYSAVYIPTGQQCISEAVATQPQGPYVDDSTFPLMCQTALGGSIDPTPFVDGNGTPYLVWKSQGVVGQPPTLWSQQLTATGTALVPGVATPLLAPSLPWQGGVIEGPSMVLTGGQYLLFYSANNWKTSDYAIGVARCTGPLGPCSETSSQPLLASQPAFSGPGGPSVFTDSSGQLQMAFHAWLPGKVGFPNSRLLFIRQIGVVDGTPTVEP